MPEEEKEIYRLLAQGEILKVEQLMTGVKQWSAKLIILDCQIKVFHVEVEKESLETVFDYSVDMDKLAKHFIYLKLLLRRMEFDLPKQAQREFYDYCKENRVSVYLITSILFHNIFYQEKVCNQIIEQYRQREGEKSERVRYFRNVLCYLNAAKQQRS